MVQLPCIGLLQAPQWRILLKQWGRRVFPSLVVCTPTGGRSRPERPGAFLLEF
jgi:hypothetical protein